jgi:hypothetical protein
MRAILVWVLSYKPDIGTWWQMVKNDADRLRRNRPFQRETKRRTHQSCA